MTEREYWQILVVDDEEEIHNVTELVLDGLSYADKPLRCLHTYSGAETMELLLSESDIAVILLDVVMENESTGLDLVKWIRSELKNTSVRIILRTGQPGYAPRLEVIKEYDINDYKEKAELTAKKLTTAIISSIRSFEQLSGIEQNRRDLEKIIRGTSSLFESHTLEALSKNVLTQFNTLLQVNPELHSLPLSGLSMEKNRDGMQVLAKIGEYERMNRNRYPEDFNDMEIDIVKTVLASKKSVRRGDYIATYFVAHNDREGIMLLKGISLPQKINLDVITLFSLHVSVAFDSYLLNREIRDTRQEIINKLGMVIDTRLTYNKGHVGRVYRMAVYLGYLLELPERDFELLRISASLHDIGLVGLSDSLLGKTGDLNEEEMSIFKQHTVIGYELLRRSPRASIRIAAEVAHQHHENYDGTGYPQGLAGKEINYFARIVQIVDIIDFYGRNYEGEEWTEESVSAYLKDQRGRKFDPEIIGTVLDHISIIMDIREDRPVDIPEDIRA